MRGREMRTRCLLLVFYVCLILISGAPNVHADSFATIPASGDTSGPPGSTEGYGYTIVNSSATDWLEIIALDPVVFQNGIPDASIFDYPIIGPGATVSESYDGTLGLYQFTWDLSAPVGFVNSGTFDLTAEFFDGDPLNGGNDLGTSEVLSAPFSVTVAGAAVPEPCTMLLFGSGLVGLVAFKKRSQKA